MSQARRTSSRNSLLSEREGNKSNSNNTGQKRNVTVQKDLSVKKQNSASSLKILGQDDEVSEESLYKGSLSDRSTPISSRSRSGILRPGSNTSRRTPTPSKQISLQAVRRKEESIEPLEPINWSELDQPFLAENDRIPALTLSDDESDLTLGSRPLSAEEQLAMIELRTKELTSALSSVHMDDNELDLSRQLEQIETAREDRERYEREKMIREERSRTAGISENTLTVEDGQFTYRNEHFRDLSHRDPKDKIDKSFIMEGRGKTKDDMLKVGKSSEGQLLMDTTPETAVAIDAKTEIPEKTEDKIEEKKVEGATKDESTSSDDDSDDGDDDDDLIGEKGKAPNALLMEFLTCMMEEDYENAEKLCKMILIYEPENPEALSFYPLIQEKRQMEEAEEDDDDDDDSSDDSDDSGEEEDSDDDDDDDDDDDGDDDDDNNSSDSEVEPVPHTDSGIASANSD